MDAFIGYKASGVRRESKLHHHKHYQTHAVAQSVAQNAGAGGRISARRATHGGLLHEMPFDEQKSKERHSLKGGVQTPSSVYSSMGEEDISLRTWLEEEVASHLRTISSKMETFEAKIDRLSQKVTYGRVDPPDAAMQQGSCPSGGQSHRTRSEQQARYSNRSSGSFSAIAMASCSEEVRREAEYALATSSTSRPKRGSTESGEALYSEKGSEQQGRIRWKSITSDDEGGHRRISRFSEASAHWRMLRKSYTGISLGSAVSAVSGYGAFFRHRYSKHGRFGKFMNGKIGIHLKNFLEDSESSTAAHIYSIAMPIFITLSVVFTILQSLDPPVVSGVIAVVTELSIDLIFLIEAFVRCLVSPDRWEFCTNTYNMFDIIGIVPLVMRICLWVIVGLRLPEEEDGGWLVFLRSFLLLIVPTMRLLKTLRWFEKFHLVVCAFEACLEALPILLWPLVLITLVFSSLIYSVEPEDNITSLPKAMWLTVVTMTTVGYGDVTPNTSAGSIIVGILVICSVLYMAMPLGIIGHAFTEIWQERDRILLMKRTRDRLTCWGYSPQDVPEVFKMFDRDGDGRLNYSEFHKMIKRMGVGLKEHRILQLFEVFDEDATGEVDYEEFVNNLFPYRNLLDFLGEKNRETVRKSIAHVLSTDGDRSSAVEHRSSLTGSHKPGKLSAVRESSLMGSSPLNENLSKDVHNDKDKENCPTHSSDSDHFCTVSSDDPNSEEMKRLSADMKRISSNRRSEQVMPPPLIEDCASVLPGSTPCHTSEAASIE